jgi:hypothetical protein
MAKFVSSASGPIPSEPENPAPRLTDGKEVIIVQLFDKRVTDKYVEFRLQYSTGELERFRYWFDSRTNKQRRETALALKNLPPSLEAAVQTKKERVHDKRKTRALGNRLRGEAQRNQS